MKKEIMKQKLIAFGCWLLVQVLGYIFNPIVGLFGILSPM